MTKEKFYGIVFLTTLQKCDFVQYTAYKRYLNEEEFLSVIYWEVWRKINGKNNYDRYRFSHGNKMF